MRTRHHRNPILTFEALETRQLLAGNVLATFSGGTLSLIGDQAANEIGIRQNAVGDLIVSGKDTSISTSPDGGATWIAGTNAQFANVNYLFILLGGGDDALTIANATIPNTFISGQQGNDSLRVINSVVKAKVQGNPGDIAGLYIIGDDNSGFTGNTGSDTIVVDGVDVIAQDLGAAIAAIRIIGDRNLNSTISGGNDEIKVVNTRVLASGGITARYANASIYIEGDLNLNSTVIGGNDSILLRNNTVQSSMLTLFGFSRSIASIDVRGETNSNSSVAGGNDSIRVTSNQVSASGPATIDSALIALYGEQNSASTIDGGNDEIAVTNSNLSAPTGTAQLYIYGDGFASGGTYNRGAVDQIDVGSSSGVGSSSSLLVDSAFGNDSVSVQDSMFQNINIQLGDGNDEFRFRRNSFTSALLDGGLGRNSLSERFNVGTLIKTGF